jgi:hypothetical protein
MLALQARCIDDMPVLGDELDDRLDLFVLLGICSFR